MVSFSYIFRVVGFYWLLLGVGNASAGSFSVKPTRVFLKDVPQIVMTIGNAGESEVFIQTELMAWAQQDEKDVYTASREVLASPPMFKIPAGGEQTVRVRLMRDGVANKERTFRLFFQEVPQEKSEQTMISTTLKMGVPIFIQPTKMDLAKYVWRATRSAEGVTLHVNNTTNNHIQITSLKLSDSGGKALSDEGVFTYVLSGQAYHWDIKFEQPWQGDKLLLQANSDRGEIKAIVELATSSTIVEP